MNDEVLMVARLLACPTRLAVLRTVADRGQDVTDIAGQLGLGVGITSYHLLALLDGGLVRVRRCGRRRLYALARRRWFVALDESGGSTVAEDRPNG